MLKLKRVELQGFKSFCDRTELRFNGEGIAAIVGPNGCGKSNISDAISWVLGEQSAKSLRGARMEDVIFAGTRDRKPLGMAYVTMTLVDPDVYNENHAHKLQPVEGGHPPKNARSHHHAPPVPLRGKRIPDRRACRPAARHTGHLHGHRPGAGKLRHHRAGAHRADSELQAAGPARSDRRSGRNHQVQDAEAPGRGQAGRRQAESGARVRHSGGSHAAGEFAQAAGIQGQALWRTQDGTGYPFARGAGRQVPPAGARCGQDGDRPEYRRRRVEIAGRAGGRARTGAREPAGGLLRGGIQAHRSAPATVGAAGGSRAHARTAGRAGKGKRNDRAAHRAEREGHAGSGRAPRRAG